MRISVSDAIDTSGRYTFQEYMIAVLPLFHSLMFFYEEQQVNGMTFLVDYGGVKMSIITWIGLDNMRHSAEFINVSYTRGVQKVLILA